jgi:hypothetical protein
MSPVTTESSRQLQERGIDTNISRAGHRRLKAESTIGNPNPKITRPVRDCWKLAHHNVAADKHRSSERAAHHNDCARPLTSAEHHAPRMAASPSPSATPSSVCHRAPRPGARPLPIAERQAFMRAPPGTTPWRAAALHRRAPPPRLHACATGHHALARGRSPSPSTMPSRTPPNSRSAASLFRDDFASADVWRFAREKKLGEKRL